ncbi:hypothetical protein [Neobacillus niacini]|uniref:hypothetical protein n=1 Tax=Neobacillus niacini TaxID=86668 RepID=UPI003983D0FF
MATRNGLIFEDRRGFALPNGENLKFIMYYNELNQPEQVIHLFEGECPYCKQQVKAESTCEMHGCPNGDIQTHWNSENFSRIFEKGKKKFR